MPSRPISFYARRSPRSMSWGDKLSPARAEALLDEFEQEIGGAFLRQDRSAVMANCEEYARRFRALREEED
jgi:hypothetical protein